MLKTKLQNKRRKSREKKKLSEITKVDSVVSYFSLVFLLSSLFYSLAFSVFLYELS